MDLQRQASVIFKVSKVADNSNDDQLNNKSNGDAPDWRIWERGAIIPTTKVVGIWNYFRLSEL